MTPTLTGIDGLEGEIVGQPDKAFVTNLITGLREGFFTGISEQPVYKVQITCKQTRSPK